MNTKIHSVYDVFTPTKPAILTFVERDGINNKLVRALRTPGKQIVVYGHSGSGKTTLLHNKLNQVYETHLTSRCVSSTTFEQLILDAFDQLGPFFQAEAISKKKIQVGSSVSAEYEGIKSILTASACHEHESKALRVIPPQLTIQQLGRFVGASGCCWVLEDFHKISPAEKTSLAEAMKVFMDLSVDYPALKIIALGAVQTAREVVEYESNMHGRVAEVHVPLMNDSEIESILTLGESRMNASFPASVKRDIVRYSNGLATVCHQLALNTCDAHHLYETSRTLKAVGLTEKDFVSAIESYVTDESDSLQKIFDRALRRERRRTYDNCRLILEPLAASKHEHGLTKGELFAEIRKTVPKYPSGNLTNYLDQLQCEQRFSIIRHDPNSGRYDFANPFHKVFARLLFRGTDVDLLDFQLDFESADFTEFFEGMVVRLQDVSEKLRKDLEAADIKDVITYKFK